ncbi:MAG: hypothetical protein ABWY02_06350 [Telluria sp.]
MDKPQVGDRLDPVTRPPPGLSGLVDAGRLRDMLAGMYAHGDDADERYSSAVEALRDQPEQTMVAIAAEYGSAAADYPKRRALVAAAGTLAHEHALPFLASVALSDIPQEGAADPHSFSTVQEETIIRMAAVEGIAAHAAKGDGRAIELLLRCVASPSFSVRRAAVTGLIESPHAAGLRSELEQMVPKEQHFIFDLKKVHVRDATQVQDPRRHLAGPERGYGESKPPLDGDGRPADRPQVR